MSPRTCRCQYANVEVVMWDVSPNVQYDVVHVIEDIILDISGIYLSV